MAWRRWFVKSSYQEILRLLDMLIDAIGANEKIPRFLKSLRMT